MTMSPSPHKGQRTIFNLAELVPAVQSLEKALSCSSCHQVIEKDLQIHYCGDANYCRQCCTQLSHCLACDEPLQQTLSLDKVLAINAAANVSPGRPPRNVLNLLQQIVDHELLADRNQSGGQQSSSPPRMKRVSLDIVNQSTGSAAGDDEEVDEKKKSAPSKPTTVRSPTFGSRKRRRRPESPHQAQVRQKDGQKMQVISETQLVSMPETLSFTLPSTCDFARRMERVDAPVPSKYDESQTLKEADWTQANSGGNSTYRSQRMTQNSSLSVGSLPNTMDFARQLSETKSTPLAPSKLTVVAVESISREHAELFRKVEGEVQVVARICRSTIDMDDCVVLPSHFLTESNEARVCSRTFEYLKAMALGLHIVDTSWIADREETTHQVWGDSQLAQRVSEVKEGINSPYSWLMCAEWWGTSRGPCQSSTRRRSRNADPLMDGFLVHILESRQANSEQRLLEAEEAELLCLFAGADSIIALDEDRSCFEREGGGEKRIVLVPDYVTSDSLLQLLKGSDTTIPSAARLESRVCMRSENEAIVVKESWLVDSISADNVAPLALYSIGVLRW